MPEEVPHFIPPEIQNNPFGWGPCEMPDQFKDMPYQPFSKGDRIGKVRCLMVLITVCICVINTYTNFLSRFLTGLVCHRTKNI